MTNIRIQETSDGVCTVYIGHQVIVAGLSRLEASTLVDTYHRQNRRVYPVSRSS
jgi:DNA-binding PadR family transcriptional regulator